MLTRLALAIFLGLALSLTLLNRAGFATIPDYDEGDDAANAFRITRAKHGAETVGNYSRWNFNHPGPAFFYVYAAGEIVLSDWLKIAPATRNAHLYAGLLLQLAFLAAALALVARESSRPGLLAGLLVLAAAWHYARVPAALYSIWPPHVLLMPFLCFLTAVAALAAGRRDALPLLVLSGGFLIHGHVVMLLFVPLLAALGLAAGVRRLGRAWLAPGAALWISLVLAALFAGPLVLDLCAGRDSNAYRIYLYLHYRADEHNSWLQSLLVWLSYFVYTPDQQIFNRLAPSSYADFHARWPLFFLWIFLAAVPWIAWRRRPAPLGFPAWLPATLLGVFAAGSALTAYWGVRQAGGFTYFNSYFNHSLTFLLPAAALLAAVELIPSAWPAWPALPVGLLAVAAFAARLPLQPADCSRAHLIQTNLPALLAADPQPGSSKIILFDNDSWYEAATLGRTLQTRGTPFRVDPFWRLMFSDDFIFADPDQDLPLTRGSVWRLARRDRLPAARPLTREFGIVYAEPRPLGALPAGIDFLDARTRRDFVLWGIDGPESAWAWSTARLAALEFAVPPSSTDVRLELDAGALIDLKHGVTGQRVLLYFNGQKVLDQTIRTRTTLTARIPAALWQKNPSARIVFALPDAIAPSRLRLSADQRTLGLQLHRLGFSPLPPAHAP